MMFTTNPFAAMSDFVPPTIMQAYIVLMIIAVAIGTVFESYHKGSAKFFAGRRKRSYAAAEKRLSGGETFALAVETIAEAAVSGEFCKWPRRASHLLMMYGFVLYLITTIVMVFGYLSGDPTPTILPSLWTLGGVMIVIGGYWFFFFLRVNVAYDGASPLHLGRADLFIGSLLASVTLGLVWHFVQTTSDNTTAVVILFSLYIFFTTMLFVTVPSSKFAHMFYKPVVAFQRRVEEASGSSDLPRRTSENYIVRS